MRTDVPLADRVAIVTGAGRGIGKAIALAYAAAGARVVLVSRTAGQLEETAAEIAATGGEASVLPLDVTVEGAPDHAIQASLDRYGRVDALLFGAGVSVTRPALELTYEDWEYVLGANLRSAFFWAQAAARRMVKTGGGRIIFLTSVLGQVAVPWLAPYSASKGGLSALTRALAVEWGQYEITVNAIAPGFVKTAMTDAGLSDERMLNRLLKRMPLGRLGQVDEITGAALFLASDSSRYMTGQVLAIDGGYLAS